MALRFTVLASGSAGNASLVEADGCGVLIDAGLGPRQLSARLAAVGRSWSDVQAVLLTHTHSDHWKDRTLAHLCRRRTPLYCHPDHHLVLLTYSPGFAELRDASLVRPFEPHAELELAPNVRCRPFPIRHDGGATFGFRLEGGSPHLFGQGTAVGYVADLGSWDDELADLLADVDLLAVEFNHDVALERASGRMPRLIARVLGDDGHLSNEQGAALVRAVLERSAAGRVKHVVQLHLSRDCNSPALARAAAHPTLTELAPSAELHTAEQDAPGVTLHLGGGPSAPPRRPHRLTSRPRPAAPTWTQQWLPGLDGGVG
jgi:phosphoribosyl 1,2-cyclic phosphodiesterase